MADRAPDPRSGVGEAGEWEPAFPGQRPPFKPGHALRATHGATSALTKIEPRALEVADTLRPLVPMWRDAFEPLVRLVAAQMARAELVYAYLGDEGIFSDRTLGELRPVFKYLGQLENSIARNLAQLGMSPLAMAQLGLDVARTGHAESLVELAARARHEELVEGVATEVEP